MSPGHPRIAAGETVTLGPRTHENGRTDPDRNAFGSLSPTLRDGRVTVKWKVAENPRFT